MSVFGCQMEGCGTVLGREIDGEKCDSKFALEGYQEYMYKEREGGREGGGEGGREGGRGGER